MYSSLVIEKKFLFLLSSGRAGGNSELLAQRAAATLPVTVAQQWLRLEDLDLPAFRDVRHEPDGAYAMPEGGLGTLLDATLAATDLVIVAPLYWYGLPASAKLYLDHWSGWLRVPGVEFKARMAGKTMWAISTYSDNRPSMAEPMFETLRLSAAYLNMRWGGEVLGSGNRPGDVTADAEALRRAEQLFDLPNKD